jgi:hypothetical protein
MRLIDADELMEHVGRDKLDSREAIMEMVKNAPTIEPRPRGKWIDAIVADTLPVIVCDQCNTFFPLAFGASHNFCPNCGADMREEET